jgi:hypothetical protein
MFGLSINYPKSGGQPPFSIHHCLFIRPPLHFICLSGSVFTSLVSCQLLSLVFSLMSLPIQSPFLAKFPLGMSYSFGAKAKGWDIFCNLLYNPSLPLSPSTWSIFPPFPIFLFNFTLD